MPHSGPGQPVWSVSHQQWFPEGQYPSGNQGQQAMPDHMNAGFPQNMGHMQQYQQQMPSWPMGHPQQMQSQWQQWHFNQQQQWQGKAPEGFQAK